MTRSGPLAGVRVLEMAGLGPAPFCAMLLSDLGADVVRIDRPSGPSAGQAIPSIAAADQVLSRGRRSVTLDLRSASGRETAADLADAADILIEGFRPGVMERLGLGPEALLQRNPKLVYGRMTGWGQDGPWAKKAGHDINYAGLSGALHAIGPKDKPAVPLNVVADFGGGSLYLAMGVLAALVHARTTGQGQVVDAAMVDGAASLIGFVYGAFSLGAWADERQSNLLDGGTPYYDTYQCADGGWLAVGPLEPQFFALFAEALGLDAGAQHGDPAALRAQIGQRLRARTRDEWCAIFDGTDACVTPVLSLAEAPLHPHNAARGTFVEIDGVVQPGPAPRFSATPGAVQGPAPAPGADTQAVLAEWLGPRNPEATP